MVKMYDLKGNALYSNNRKGYECWYKYDENGNFKSLETNRGTVLNIEVIDHSKPVHNIVKKILRKIVG